MNNKKGRRIAVRDLTHIAFCTTLIIICAWIKIPFVIPYTMQSFGIFLCVGLLGGKRALISILLYILLGAIGLPVFSGFAGGLGILFGSTGGYILGFLMPPLLKWAAEHLKCTPKYTLALCLTLGLILCYCFGTLWYLCVYAEGFRMETLSSVLGICVAPFVLPDLLKLVLALLLTNKLKKYIK